MIEQQFYPRYSKYLRLRKEKHCVLIINNVSGLFWEITPQQAFVISLLNGKYSLQDVFEMLTIAGDGEFKNTKIILDKTISLLEELNLLDYTDYSSITAITYNPADFLYSPLPIKDYFENPISLEFVLTKGCNFRCSYCYMNASDVGNKFSDFMDMSLFKKVAEEAFQIGVKSSFLIGGEPFLDKTFLDKIKFLLDRDIYPYISTNGSLLTEEIISKLKHMGVDFIQVSLDTLDYNEFKSITKSNKLSKVIENIKILKRYNFKIRIKAVLTTQNISKLDELIRFVDSIKVHDLEIVPALESKEGRDNFNLLALNESQYKLIENQVDKLKKECLIDINLANHSEKWKDKPKKVCGGGISSLVIYPDGNVGICDMIADDNFMIGNLNENTLNEIWNSENLYKLRKIPEIRLQSKCKECSFLDVCRTGCFNSSKVADDDYFAPDSNCMINEKVNL